jgi:magnesium-transporting ATPase (P-type)
LYDELWYMATRLNAACRTRKHWVLMPSAQAKDNMLFASTAVANGAGVGIVNSIGMATEIGKIQAQIQEAAKEEDDTPLKKKIDEFGELLAKVGRVG